MFAFAVGEEYLFAGVVELRIADAAFGVIEEGAGFSVADIEQHKGAAIVIVLAGFVDDVIAEIGIPVAVTVGLADGKDDIVEAKPVGEVRAVMIV